MFTVLAYPQKREKEGLDMRVYVASQSSNAKFALRDGNILEVCHTGPDPLLDAKSYAQDHTRATDEPSYVYEVDIKQVQGYKIVKEVVGFVPPKF